ncbi:Gfo/Idh/MocA family protein [Cellulomonas sp. HZM]|uniref:Gfo/Idh/MocA family protein n=1 Tax=Cellulomonas sp. HZM TaxID=1454010 RepID=UPI000492F87E|nr:Gfo/Idh/MocA family oxidoreductase [Cellulomonas sp. HZM]
MTPLRFGVIGSGWRAEFFVRMARLFPERFTCVGVVTRGEERGREVEQQWGVPTVRRADELDRPDLVVVATPWPATPDAIRELTSRGVRVLAETPPAPDEAGLRRLWDDVGGTGLVQVAEHSPFMPAHEARTQAVRAGLIGEATSVQISSTHLYHAVGLIRSILQTGRHDVTVRASTHESSLVDPMNRDGFTGDVTPKTATTILATLDFGNGKSALYDFTDNQWHNPLRTNRIVIRGSHGEIVGDEVTRWVDERTILTSSINRRVSGLEQNLDGFDLEHLSLDGTVLYRNEFHGARLADDDLAVAGLLDATARWVRGDGPEPYPLADGCHDHLVGLAIEEAGRTGQPVYVQAGAWAG